MTFFKHLFRWIRLYLFGSSSLGPDLPDEAPPPGGWSKQDLKILELLDFIRKHEAPEGYDQIYSEAEALIGKWPLTTMTIDEVRMLQNRMLAAGSPSSAAGGFQFLQPTLESVQNELRVPGSTVFTKDIQIRFAWRLMERRGLKKYLAGTMRATTFADNLAMEWASLPVQRDMRGHHRMVTRGQSYYTGDGLNKALTSPEAVMEKVEAIKS